MKQAVGYPKGYKLIKECETKAQADKALDKAQDAVDSEGWPRWDDVEISEEGGKFKVIGVKL